MLTSTPCKATRNGANIIAASEISLFLIVHYNMVCDTHQVRVLLDLRSHLPIPFLVGLRTRWAAHPLTVKWTRERAQPQPIRHRLPSHHLSKTPDCRQGTCGTFFHTVGLVSVLVGEVVGVSLGARCDEKAATALTRVRWMATWRSFFAAS
jgi:hypothetical protein